MGLIGSFFGLLFGGGYVTAKLSSQKSSDREYEERRETFRQSFDEMSTSLRDFKLETIVKAFVSNQSNANKLSEMLKNEIEYITFGDSSVQLLEQQKIDLVMSRFGKISSLTFSECSRFGNLTKVGTSLDSYTVSIRVMQCIESNIYAKTGRYVMFGVKKTEPCFNDKYCSAKISVIFGGGFIETLRIYSSVEIPFEPIGIEDLTNEEN